MDSRTCSTRSTLLLLISAALIAITPPAALAAEVAAYKPQLATRADGIQIVRGAEDLGEVVPASAYVDARTLPLVPAWQPGDPLIEIPRQYWGEAGKPTPVPVNPASPLDPLVDRQFGMPTVRGNLRFETPVINVAGDATQASPPDSTGEVGTSHFVEAVNGAGGSSIRIFNKSDGSLAAGPFQLNSAAFAGPGANACGTGGGDPVVMFDELAKRWVLTEFSSTSGRSLCVYVSSGSNPVATTWSRYAFKMPAFPDYPKYGVWPNAYFVGANEGGTAGARPVYAMERAKMLAGLPAAFQRITTPKLQGFGFDVIVPADLDGNQPPPSGAPGLFLRHRDDEAHVPGSNNPTRDQLQLYSLDVNFSNPANTVLTGPINIEIAEFSSDLAGLSTFSVFPQPTAAGLPNGTMIDALREPIMNKLVYRNFIDYEVLVGNLISDIDGNDTGGIRWFELRRVGGSANPWTLHQEGTYAGAGPVQDGADRWMGATSMDESGNIAMGFSVVRDTAPPIWPSLRYVGRLDDAPLGSMGTAEITLAAGTGTHPNARWGDYHQMSVDPVDGCTFWFVGEYMPTAQKGTRIGAFRFEQCGTPTFTLAANNLEQRICAPGTLAAVAVSVGNREGFNSPVALGFASPLPTGFTGTYVPPTVTPPGNSTLSVVVNNTATPGPKSISIQGTAGAIDKTLPLNVFVATAIPGSLTSTAPTNGASNVSATPILSWVASTQAQSYTVEVSTTSNFSNIVFTRSDIVGTNLQVTPALATTTQYFWRVSASNACGASANTETASFTTERSPGDCAAGFTANTVFMDGVETGANGWTATGTGGAWAISAQRPFGGTGSAWLATDVATTSDQLLVSPSIALPSGQNPVTLQFESDQTLESNGAAQCSDGGFLEVSTNNATSWVPLPSSAMLTDPYNGALPATAASQPAWCGDPQPYLKSVVDLSAFAGQNVRLRFRARTDSNVGRVPHGWYVDNISVQSCRNLDVMFANGFE